MPIIDTSITLDNLEKAKTSILDLMGNPYCDHQMFMSLTERLDETNKMILELQEKEIQSKKPK